MERLDALVEEKERKEIMTGCACRYPKSDLREIGRRYEITRDVEVEVLETVLKGDEVCKIAVHLPSD
ncbi:MAG: hypothetical protein E3J21_20575 [Anaerolineales bacterium]|nr:MAG: hypothetical protein E3J21_20575 [Anaerolineales bacterium]